ncbi:hypothetical protein HDU67_000372 [Dinochytrium kinnereticum]|nr:hypothetical protein HDU67_000372 [Dinochytrium kinnereticum]
MTVTLDLVFQDRDEKLRALYASLEAAIKEKDGFIQEAAACWKSLKEDFTYNLTLLEERDAELERYDVAVESMKTELNQKDAIISELKILLSDRANEINSLTLLIQSQDKHHHETSRKLRLEKENVLQELQQTFSSKELALEQKLTKLEIASSSMQSELEELRTRESEKKLKSDIWELGDQKKHLSSRILELEGQLDKVDLELKKTNASNEEQRQSILNHMNEMESNHCKEKSFLIENAARLQMELDDSHANARCDRQLHEEEIIALDQLIRAKDNEIEQLRQVVTKQEGDIARLVETQSSEVTQLESELESKERKLNDLQYSLERQISDCAHMQEELKLRIENESKLQTALSSRDIHFRDQIEDMKRKKERESSTVISSLRSDKESLEAELERLRQRNERLQAQLEKYTDQALQDEETQREIFELRSNVEYFQKENENLVQTIRAMREDMESVQNTVFMKNVPSSEGPISTSFLNEIVASNSQVKALVDIIKTKQDIIDSMIQGQGHIQARSERSYPNAVIADELEEARKENAALKTKLRQAVDDIVSLSRERAKILEISNATKAMLNFSQKPPKRFKTTAAQTIAKQVKSAPEPVSTRRPGKSSSPIRSGTKTAKPTPVIAEDPAALRRQELRARGVRNWNERDD